MALCFLRPLFHRGRSIQKPTSFPEVSWLKPQSSSSRALAVQQNYRSGGSARPRAPRRTRQPGNSAFCLHRAPEGCWSCSESVNRLSILSLGERQIFRHSTSSVCCELRASQLWPAETARSVKCSAPQPGENHRIIESFGSEGTPGGHLVQHPRSEQGHR